MRRGLVALFSFASLAFVACAPTRYEYAPVATTSGVMPGVPSVDYKVPGSGQGDVRLGAVGITTIPSPGVADVAGIRAAHLRMTVTNRSGQTWTVDGSEQRLELEKRQPIVAALGSNGAYAPTVAIAPGMTQSIDLYFPLPADQQKVTELPKFSAIWTVRTGGQPLTERTSFERVIAQPAPSPPQRDLPGSYFLDPWNAQGNFPTLEPPDAIGYPPDNWPPTRTRNW
ncbi:hypothetical protein AKJ09_05541 [Labilithrix luteola]|uniref:Lipoprotein n=1 Tax=Labilithrix luteola TaxID=1391654 RepID=A0A0K1PZF6_9BACT|nr:hypothetical protein [Labilithrix luteola]AKU98877.1 hypothetical protein AKJ09_05541 [Labilithrix luteola]